MILELPLSSDPAQRFTTQLGDKKYDFDVKYNDRSGVWTMDMADNASKLSILSGVPLVLGQELLEPYNLAIGQMLVVDGTNQGKEAGPDDLGDRVKLYWISPDEVIA